MGLFSKPKAPTNKPDTLFSEDVVEIILGLSEGPIKGLAEDSPRSFLVADTPLVDVNGQPNIGQFDLRMYPGENPGGVIVPKLGGTGSSTNVGVALETNTSVTRSGTYQNLDYIEVRIAINRLVLSNTKGSFETNCKFKVEIKPSSSSTWNNAYTDNSPPTFTSAANYKRFTHGTKRAGTQLNPAYREMYIQTTAPSSPVDSTALWFDSDDSYRPYRWNGSSWVLAGATLFSPAGGYQYWAFTDNGKARRAFFGNLTGQAPPPNTLHDLWLAPPGTLGQGNSIGYSWNGSTWTNENDWKALGTNTPGVISITGKTTSTYVKEMRFPVNKINDTYDIRVTKLSPVNSTEYFCDITWESFQELTNEPLEFDDLALCHLIIKSSDQFSSIPEFAPICEGRLINVPSNYNPTTKVYTGVWDGTFQQAYSTNGAWIAYDLVMNDRYGMNAYRPVAMDKYAVYAFAQHWDRIGFTFNEWIQQPRDLSDAVDYICGIAGGRFVDQGDGFTTVLFDEDDRPAVKLFSKEDVADGVFVYGFTDLTSRKNDITVSYVNEQYGWIEDRRRVADNDAISRNARNAEEFIAVGCTDETEAVKRATLRLVTAQTEKTIVNFRTNRKGLYLNIYDYFLIADEESEFGISGRIKSQTNMSTLVLRDAVYFEAGFTYVATFSTPAGLVTRNLVTSAGSTTTLTLATPLSVALPEFCQFSIECEDTVGVPKCFKVTSIDEIDGDPDNIAITGMEVNRNKWAIVTGEYVAPNITHSGIIGRSVEPVTNVNVQGVTQENGQHNIQLTWDASATSLLRFYRIYQQINAGDVTVLVETRATNFIVEGVQPARYTFSIVAVNIDGRESHPVTFDHEVLGAIRPVAAPTNLILVNGYDANTFQSPAPEFRWDASTDPFLDKYLVRIYNNGTGLLLRETETTALSFTYDMVMNTADFGTPSRTFRIEVRAKDTAGGYSQPIVKIASNPVPAVVTPVISTGLRQLYVKYDIPVNVTDIAGARIWVSSTQGFNPNVVTPTYEGPDQTVIIPVVTLGTYYVRIALYDTFNKVGLAVSPEYEILLADPDIIDQTAPAIPVAATLASAVETAPSGDLSSYVSATWPVVANASTYDVDIKEANGSFISFRTATPSYIWRGLIPNTLFTVRVRAVSTLGYASGYGPEAQITSAVKSTAPAIPAGLAVIASLKSAFLSWTAVADKDIARYEVWRNTSNASASATRVGTSGGTNFTDSGLLTGTTYWYWVKAVNTSGVASAFSSGVTVTPGQIGSGDLADTSVTAAKFASGIEPVSVVAELPVVAGYTGAKTVYLTTDGKLYTLQNGAWKVSGVSAFSELTGQVSDAQIAAVAASKVSGQLTNAQLAAIDAAKVSGQLTNAQLAAIDAAKVTGTLTDTQIAAVSASKVTGTLTDTQIAALSTSKLTGQITSTQITDNAITSGKINAGAITAGKLAVGVQQFNLVPNGNFESGLDTWVVETSTGSAVLDNTTRASGNFSVRLGSNGGLGYGKVYQAFDTKFPVSAGEVYELTARVRGELTSGNGVFLRVMWFDASHNYLGSYTDAVSNGPVTTAWQRMGGQVTGPANAFYGQIELYNWFSSANYIWFDEVSFVRAFTSTLIQDGAIITGKIAANAITAEKITAGTITGDKIAATAITTDKIAANAITAAKIAADTITSNEIAANAITSNELSANAVTAGKIAAGSIVAADIAANTITGAKIAASTILAANIAADTITSNEIAANAITAAELAAGSVTTAKLVANAVTANEIAASAVIAGKIAANAVSANEIAANAVTSDKIIANAIVTGKIAAGAVNADAIAANAITASKLTVGIVENLVLNPSFDDGLNGWVSFGPVPATVDVDPYWVYSGSQSLRFDRTTSMSYNAVGSSTMPVAPGEVYELSAWVRGLAASNNGLYLRIIWLDANKQQTIPYTDVYDNAAFSTTYEKKSGQATAPPAARFAIIHIYHYLASSTQYMWVDDVSFSKVLGATKIQDGAIVTNKIAANAIVADKIQAGVITGDKLNINTSLPATITVGTSGVSIGSVQSGVTARTAIWLQRFTNSTTGGGTPNSCTLTGGPTFMTLVTTGADPFYNLGSVSFSGARARYLRVLVSTNQAQSAAARVWQFFWNVYTEANSKTVILPEDHPVGVNNVFEVLFDMYALNGGSTTAWRDATINNIRLDIGSNAGQTWYIHEISAVYFGSATEGAPAGTLVGSTEASVLVSNAALGAQDPATRINAASTTIDPGKVTISGATTLASWRNGTDATKIEGGSIAANSILANRVSIGLRGIDIAGIQFSYDKNFSILYWTAGAITYTNNAGSRVSVAITAGNVSWTAGTVFVAWQQGATTLSTATTPFSDDVYVNLATYRGSNDLVANYGRTIIDGANILTNSITANLITAGAIETAAIAAGAVVADKIAANSITADKLNVTSLSAVSANIGTVTAGLARDVNSKFIIDFTNARLTVYD